MSKASRRFRYKQRKYVGNVGDQPGMIHIADDAAKPLISVFSYNENDLKVSKGNDIGVILDQFKYCTNHTHWIKINGLGDVKLMEEIGSYLQINPLVLEDITNTRQRPKFDEYDGYVFVTSRMVQFNQDHELCNYQFSAIVKGDLIISFEETHDEHFEAVINRLQASKGSIRKAGPSYMCYALMDTIIDQYFVILSDVGEQLDLVEDRLYQQADKSIMYDTQHLRRLLIIMRKASWPERDKINDMIRTDSQLITTEVKGFLRDLYDHVIQIMDLIESYKEISSSIMDLYLSMVSNRMNEIMKVLTIISVIFIPLTFIAGIYGMNFARVDPATNKLMPANMPELYTPHGYLYALGGMFILAVIQVIIFWKKGWFNRL